MEGQVNEEEEEREEVKEEEEEREEVKKEEERKEEKGEENVAMYALHVGPSS